VWSCVGRVQCVGDVDLVIVADDNDPGCASVMVDGTVDGRSYRFLLDTGTGRTHIVAR
jgi:predicted aspartyl protease